MLPLPAWVAGRGVLWRCVAFVHGDVEAGLTKLFFHVDFVRDFKRQQPAAHPGEFFAAQAVFRNVNGRAGQVRAHNVAFCRRLRCH